MIEKIIGYKLENLIRQIASLIKIESHYNGNNEGYGENKFAAYWLSETSIDSYASINDNFNYVNVAPFDAPIYNDETCKFILSKKDELIKTYKNQLYYFILSKINNSEPVKYIEAYYSPYFNDPIVKDHYQARHTIYNLEVKLDPESFIVESCLEVEMEKTDNEIKSTYVKQRINNQIIDEFNEIAI